MLTCCLTSIRTTSLAPIVFGTVKTQKRGFTLGNSPLDKAVSEIGKHKLLFEQLWNSPYKPIINVRAPYGTYDQNARLTTAPGDVLFRVSMDPRDDHEQTGEQRFAAHNVLTTLKSIIKDKRENARITQKPELDLTCDERIAELFQAMHLWQREEIETGQLGPFAKMVKKISFEKFILNPDKVDYYAQVMQILIDAARLFPFDKEPVHFPKLCDLFAGPLNENYIADNGAIGVIPRSPYAGVLTPIGKFRFGGTRIDSYFESVVEMLKRKYEYDDKNSIRKVVRGLGKRKYRLPSIEPANLLSNSPKKGRNPVDNKKIWEEIRNQVFLRVSHNNVNLL